MINPINELTIRVVLDNVRPGLEYDITKYSFYICNILCGMRLEILYHFPRINLRKFIQPFMNYRKLRNHHTQR